MPNYNRQLSTIAGAARRAVIAGAYEEAGALLSSYCQQLEAELQKGSLRGDRLAEERLRTKDLLDWVFRMVCAGRAHDTARLTEIPPISWHGRAGANQLHSWQLAG